MKYGINMLLWAAEVNEKCFSLLRVIKERGFDGVEFPIFRPEGFPAARIRRALADEGLECTACGATPAGLSLLSEDAAVRANAAGYLRSCASALAEAGGHVFAGPFYSPVGYLPGRRRNDDEWRRAVEGYRELAPALNACNVTLALEPLNRLETYFLNTAADAARLVDDVADPRIGVLYDTFHANIEEKDVPAGCRTLGRRLVHAHASENDRGTPGTGHVNWPEHLRALRDIGYDGWLTIESFGSTVKEIAAAAAIWRDLAPFPEEIAFEGLAFLKRQAALAATA